MSFTTLVRGQICNFDGTTLVQGHRNPWEIVTGEIYPKMADNARSLSWGLENNIYNLGHRGYVAKPGGEHDAGLTYIKDLAAGKYKLPWEDQDENQRRLYLWLPYHRWAFWEIIPNLAFLLEPVFKGSGFSPILIFFQSIFTNSLLL